MREGISRKDECAPFRTWEPAPGGPDKGFQFDKNPWDQALDLYYRMYGWNKNGVLTWETLERLGLGSVCEELKRIKISRKEEDSVGSHHSKY